MKIMIGVIATLLAGFALASTVSQIPVPPNVTGTVKSCSATGVDTMTCRGTVSAPCSGRGCQPVQTITTYAVNGSTSVACKVTRHHLPQADVTTYTPGYDTTNCPDENVNPTGDVVTINGVPYYYVTTGPGGELIVNSNQFAYIATN